MLVLLGVRETIVVCLLFVWYACGTWFDEDRKCGRCGNQAATILHTRARTHKHTHTLSLMKNFILVLGQPLPQCRQKDISPQTVKSSVSPWSRGCDQTIQSCQVHSSVRQYLQKITGDQLTDCQDNHEEKATCGLGSPLSPHVSREYIIFTVALSDTTGNHDGSSYLFVLIITV